MNIGTPQTKVEYSGYISLLKLRNDLNHDSEIEKDVEIITLKQHLYDKAAEDAWKLTSNIDDIDVFANWLVTTKYTHAKEFVSIGEDRITIGVNAEKIDNQTIEYALKMLSKIEHLKGFAAIEFGEMIEVYELPTQ